MTDRRLAGKVAWVTGAGSGIGRATALRLAAEGASLFITDVDAGGGRATAELIHQQDGAAGGTVQFRGQDVTEEDRWAELAAKVVRLFGRLDILVNNAGIGLRGSITEMRLEDWNRQLAINVTGVFLGIKHSLPVLRANTPSGGSIINVASIVGHVGAGNMAAYSATKGAVTLLTKSVALECAAVRDGVRVNSIHPGIIDSAFWPKLGAGADGNGISGQAVGQMAPVGHSGTPEDIAGAIAFLASDDARYMTGSGLVIDGGWTAQ
jgi:NAD(P)-dependent dehydrogenase (short-subunit alcohol dehydrogenase family)